MIDQAATARSMPADAFLIETQATQWSAPAGQDMVGGDWCDIVRVSDDVLALTVGDVSGHGKVASTPMIVLRSAVLEALRESESPARILAKLNRLTYASPDNVIATAIVAFLDRRQKTFTFANAGHPPPLIVTSRGPAFLCPSRGDLPLGIFPQHRAGAYVVSLPAEALITLYTDELIEHKRDLIHGQRELARACRSVYTRLEFDAARVIAEHVFRNGRGNDDAAIIAVRIASRRAPFSEPHRALSVRTDRIAYNVPISSEQVVFR